MTSTGLLFYCVFFALHWQKKHDSWKDCKSCDSCDEERLELKPSEMFKPHICVTGNIPDIADTKSFCDVPNVTTPNTEPECIYAALYLSHCSVSPVVCSIIGCWVAAPATNLNLKVRSLHLFTHHPCPSETSLCLSHDTRRVTSSIIWK